MYATGPWFIYKGEVTLKLFVGPIFFYHFVESELFLLWNGNERG